MKFEKEGEVWIYDDESYQTNIKNPSNFAMHVSYNGYDILVFENGVVMSPEFFEINVGENLCDARVVNGFFMIQTEAGEWRACRFT